MDGRNSALESDGFSVATGVAAGVGFAVGFGVTTGVATGAAVGVASGVITGFGAAVATGVAAGFVHSAPAGDAVGVGHIWMHLYRFLQCDLRGCRHWVLALALTENVNISTANIAIIRLNFMYFTCFVII